MPLNADQRRREKTLTDFQLQQTRAQQRTTLTPIARTSTKVVQMQLKISHSRFRIGDGCTPIHLFYQKRPERLAIGEL